MTKEEIKELIALLFSDNGNRDISAQDSRDVFNALVNHLLASENVVDNLVSRLSNMPLSANQGRILANMINNSSKAMTVPLYVSDFKSGVGGWTGLSWSSDGAVVSNNNVQFSKKYGLAEMAYEVVLKGNLNILFSATGESNSGIKIDVAAQTITIITAQGNFVTKFDFYNANNTYRIRIQRNYQTIKLEITDQTTYESTSISATRDGGGGFPRVNPSFVPLFYGQFKMAFTGSTTDTIVESINITTINPKIIVYGDSVTSQDEYMPTADFVNAWGANVAKNANGVTSSIGGSTAIDLLSFIVNEVPILKPKYVMITIGTNGGNTVENISELVDIVESNGGICILNNIPCTSRGWQGEQNAIVESVRSTYNLNGALLDLPTSLAGDGVNIDTSMFYKQDYTESSTPSWGIVYHHPNSKGSSAMFNRVLLDVPEIFSY